jgi:hypothetical protein
VYKRQQIEVIYLKHQALVDKVFLGIFFPLDVKFYTPK